MCNCDKIKQLEKENELLKQKISEMDTKNLERISILLENPELAGKRAASECLEKVFNKPKFNICDYCPKYKNDCDGLNENNFCRHLQKIEEFTDEMVEKESPKFNFNKWNDLLSKFRIKNMGDLNSKHIVYYCSSSEIQAIKEYCGFYIKDPYGNPNIIFNGIKLLKSDTKHGFELESDLYL